MILRPHKHCPPCLLCPAPWSGTARHPAPGQLLKEQERQTHLLLDGPYRAISSQCPQTYILYLAVPSLLIKLTSLLDLTCLNLCILQVIKNWSWEGLRTRLSGDCLRECRTIAGKQFHSISQLSEACHG